MPSAQVTYTGVIGPGTTITTQPFLNVTKLILDFARGVAEITYGVPSATAIVAISATTTISDTITAGSHAVIISQ